MRIDESKIFNAYVESIIEESKKGKGLPPWLKEKNKGKDKETDKKDDKKDDKKSKKSGKIPEGLRKYISKKKKIKESIDTDPEVYDLSVRDLMDELQEKDPELYQKVDDFLGNLTNDSTLDVSEIPIEAEEDEEDIQPDTAM